MEVYDNKKAKDLEYMRCYARLMRVDMNDNTLEELWNKAFSKSHNNSLNLHKLELVILDYIRLNKLHNDLL